jgi:hypothetical protein
MTENKNGFAPGGQAMLFSCLCLAYGLSSFGMVALAVFLHVTRHVPIDIPAAAFGLVMSLALIVAGVLLYRRGACAYSGDNEDDE